jgi:hypothetical protein
VASIYSSQVTHMNTKWVRRTGSEENKKIYGNLLLCGIKLYIVEDIVGL